MHFFIDGYNFLFSLLEEVPPLQQNRDHMLEWLSSKFSQMELEGTLVFDGSHQRGEQSGFSYPGPLEVVFTPRGQSADAYIVEAISLVSNPKNCFVITNDRGLARHVQAYGTPVQTNHSFLQWLAKRAMKKKKKKTSFKESPTQIERLTKIFEERLEREEDV